METLNPNSNPNPNSPNKRLKTEPLTLDSSIPSSIDEGKPPIITNDNYNIASSIDKGKAPIIADDNDNDNESEDGDEFPAKTTPESCGICLIEEGKTVRGLIDSCDHYYCFLCIIEWSKIESRCPLCRGRFSSIRRVRKDGSFIGDSCVRVSVRDQIYDPFGEPADPYSQAKCSVCNGTSDEWLLLLCDLCDSASHTYCVGLGATVPEGDWYCRDCALLRAEQNDSEMGDNEVASTASPCVDEPSSTSASVSIFDIVRDPSESKDSSSGTNRLRQLVSQHPTRFSSSAIASDQPSVASARTVTGGRGTSHCSADVSESSARTLKNCRDVHRHINMLRENWDAVRAGSLSFPVALGNFSKKKSLAPTTARKSCKIQSSSSTSSSQSKALHNLGDATHNNKSYNVDRAWKLMSIAKTKEQTDKSKSACKVAQNKALSIKKNKPMPKRAVSVRKDLISPKLGKQIPSDKVSERSAQSLGEHSFTSSSASVSGCKYQKSCVMNLSMPREIKTASNASIYNTRACLASSKMLKGALSTVFYHGSPCSASSFGSTAVVSGVSCSGQQREISVRPVEQVGYSNISTSSKTEIQNSVGADICHNESNFPSESFGRQNSSIFACSTSSYEPVSYGSDPSHVNIEGKIKTACPGKVGTNTISRSCKDDEAKGEIQSLVKLNLKLLCKNKRLGVDDFKEVARRSTHTILASCGFEHRKIVRCLPTLVCHHSDQTQPLHRSNIVPKSCRECFYAFVKDVVSTIMSEKLNSAGVAS